MGVETTEYIAMLRRMIRAGARRVADCDEVELAEFLSLEDELDEAIQSAIDGQRAIGKSWAAIAAATGTSREATQQRWGQSEIRGSSMITP